jgi:hypothetical protein
VAIEEVVAGQVFKGRRTSLPPGPASQVFSVLGRCPKTTTLVTGLEAARGSDMPSKSVGGRKSAGGFDSRPPPLRDCALTSAFATKRQPARPAGTAAAAPDNQLATPVFAELDTSSYLRDSLPALS